MSYLTRLKQIENEKNSQYIPDTEPSKPTELPFDGFVGTPLAHIEKNFIEETGNEILDIPIGANHQNLQKYRCWLVHFADREPMEAYFSPEATHAEVLEWYPSAIAAEPFKLPEVVET